MNCAPPPSLYSLHLSPHCTYLSGIDPCGRPPFRSRRDQSLLKRLAQRFGTAGDIEFLVDIRQVEVYCALAYDEAGSDLFVLQPPCRQLKDCLLSRWPWL